MTTCCSNPLKYVTNQIKIAIKQRQKWETVYNIVMMIINSKKVGTVCDKFIKYKDERAICIKWLLSSQVKQYLSVSTEEWDTLEVLEE